MWKVYTLLFTIDGFIPKSALHHVCTDINPTTSNNRIQYKHYHLLSWQLSSGLQELHLQLDGNWATPRPIQGHAPQPRALLHSDFDVCETWKRSDVGLGTRLRLLETVGLVEQQQMELRRIMKGQQTPWGWWPGGIYQLQRGPWVYRAQRAPAGTVYRWCSVYRPLYSDDVWRFTPPTHTHCLTGDYGGVEWRSRHLWRAKTRFFIVLVSVRLWNGAGLKILGEICIFWYHILHFVWCYPARDKHASLQIWWVSEMK